MLKITAGNSLSFLILTGKHRILDIVLVSKRPLSVQKSLFDGAEWDGLVEGNYTCISRLVSKKTRKPDYFNSAIWFHNLNGGDTSEQKFYQLVWPSVHGKLFPWEAECPKSVIKAQLNLYD